MNDEELIDALRTGLDAVDPPPASLRAKAIAAGTWSNQGTTEAAPRFEAELVGAGMRSSDSLADDTVETTRDLSFDAAGHAIDITIEFSNRGDSSAELIVIVAPRVDTVTVVSPFDEPMVADLDASGQATLRLESSPIALQFTADSGALVRTPLIRLF